MTREYKCLNRQIFQCGKYKLIPIRDEDKLRIMQWRNDQIDALRQEKPLSVDQQLIYFANIVDKLFDQERPDQLLFSFLADDKLIGYGGLVHIDWTSRNAEVSFLTETQRANSEALFVSDWVHYLKLAKEIAETDLNFLKIYTYSYNIRPPLYHALSQSFFIQEARLTDHILVKGELRDVLIHSYFIDNVDFKEAKFEDMMVYFNWANEAHVRHNSFNQEPIPLEKHRKWFSDKLASPRSLLLLATFEDELIGQVRFEDAGDGVFEIHFSIAKNQRGKGFGKKIVRSAVEYLARKNAHIKRVIGKVKPHNLASIRSFLGAGFTATPARPDHVLEFSFDRVF